MNAEPPQTAEPGQTTFPAPAASPPPAAPLAVRRRTLLFVIATSVALAALGMSAPLWIKSPQQLAVEASAPSLSLLTAPVERRVLRDVVVLRGDVGSAHTIEITPADPAGGDGVITAIKVRPGDEVSAGTVVLEISGRPLLLLPGAVPGYRDLKPGAHGRDVAQLQAALARLGHDPGEHGGVFGVGTKRALTAAYADRGYEPLPVSDADAERLAGLRAQITAANRQVEDARRALDALDPGTPPPEREQATVNLARANEDLAAARAALAQAERTTGPMLPQSEYAFVPSFPARIEATKAVLGGGIDTPLVTVATGPLVVKTELTVAQRGLCRPGATVEITGDGGLVASATVTSVADLAEEDPGADPGAKTSGYPMVVTPTSTLATRFAGRNVRLRVAVSSSGTEQLVVPISALYASADGLTYVSRLDPDGHKQQVTVEAGLSAGGYVAVTEQPGPPGTPTLSPGDLVVVGVE